MKPKPFYVGQIVGTKFHKASQSMKVGAALTLRTVPGNKYVPNAIAVDHTGNHVGYIARKDTARFHVWLTEDTSRTLALLQCRCGPSWDHITVTLP